MQSFFRSLSISNKIAAVFMMLLVMMGVGGSIGLYNSTRISHVTTDLYTKSFNWLSSLSSLEKEFLSQRQQLFLHITVTDKASKEYLFAVIMEQQKEISSLVEEYRSLGPDAEEQRILDRFVVALEEYQKLQKEVLALSMSGRTDKAVSIMREDGKKSFNNALNELRSLYEHESIEADLSSHRAKEIARTTYGVTIIMTFVAIVMAVWLWRLLSGVIVKPIMRIEESAKRLSEGNLKERVPVLSGDELGSLAREFNMMAENLEQYYVTLEHQVDSRTGELKQANLELSSSKDELEVKNLELARASQMKSQFLANVSHELRTPLNSIIGFSELLQEKSFGELNEKQTQYVKYVHTSGAHLLQLINSILDLSKIEAGRMELLEEDFSLVDVLQEVLGTIRPIARKRHISIDIRTSQASPVVNADKGKFKQIMLNLLSNSVKFNEDDGEVFVDWEIKQEPSGMGMQRYLYVSVTDTGVGIKPEDLGRLFKEFEQLDSAVTREQVGTGLGLALTKRLAELHSGSILVDSELGKGSTFTVKLPQKAYKEEMVPAHVAVGLDMTHAMNSPLILVAGESEDMVQLLKLYLTEEYYRVVSAMDGDELMEKVGEEKPFAIVADVALPKKDGWEVLGELKANDETSDIPVVLVSFTDNNELGFAIGAVDYLLKPVDRDKLLNSLNSLHFVRYSANKCLKILVIDDEPQALTLLDGMLSEEGFEVLKAPGGEEGIRMAMDEEPDLIILDLMMPVVSGFDVIDRLRENHITKNIPIIIFSAKELDANDRKRLGANMEKVIKKAAFTKDELLSEIKLFELSFPQKANLVDGITGLFNKRYFDILFSRELARDERYGEVLSILLLDIDDMKIYNEHNGVENGNRALYYLGNLLKDNLRKADCVTRYGGDEFAVLLPGIPKEEAVEVGEKLRALVEKKEFTVVKGKKGGVTVSVAVADLKSECGGHVGIIEALEELLEETSSGGGNTVSVL